MMYEELTISSYLDEVPHDAHQPTGHIAIHVADKSFPGPEWNDFIIVVIGWWVNELLKLSSGERYGELLFMDGPYKVSLSAREDAELNIGLIKNGELIDSFIVQTQNLIDEVLRNANFIIRQCRNENHSSDDVHALEKNYQRLQLEGRLAGSAHGHQIRH